MNGPEQKGIRIAMDAIAHTNSGLQDLNQKITLSFLHKAIKSLNQLENDRRCSGHLPFE